MLFNSFEFIFAFLPITIFVFFQIGKYNRSLAAAWLGLASLFFYGWWNPAYIILLLGSILFNYFIGIFLSDCNLMDKFTQRSVFLYSGLMRKANFT